MASNIDISKPVAGTPTTASVRDNFAFAKAEIEALQAAGGSSVVLQMTEIDSRTSSIVTATFPWDDTIPQRTEGTEILSLSFTPLSATSRLQIDYSVSLSMAASQLPVLALFSSTQTDALVAQYGYESVRAMGQFANSVVIASASMTSRVYSVRAGMHAAGTMSINGIDSVRWLGGALSSKLRITEVSP